MHTVRRSHDKTICAVRIGVSTTASRTYLPRRRHTLPALYGKTTSSGHDDLVELEGDSNRDGGCLCEQAPEKGGVEDGKWRSQHTGHRLYGPRSVYIKGVQFSPEVDSLPSSSSSSPRSPNTTANGPKPLARRKRPYIKGIPFSRGPLLVYSWPFGSTTPSRNLYAQRSHVYTMGVFPHDHTLCPVASSANTYIPLSCCGRRIHVHPRFCCGPPDDYMPLSCCGLLRIHWPRKRRPA